MVDHGVKGGDVLLFLSTLTPIVIILSTRGFTHLVPVLSRLLLGLFSVSAFVYRIRGSGLDSIVEDVSTSTLHAMITEKSKIKTFMKYY